MSLRARINALARATRPRREIEADINEEFAHHLELLKSEIRRPSGGGSASETAAIAAEQFGDVDALRRQCVDIQLENRTMLMKLNAILTAALLLAVGTLAWIVVRNSAEQTRALNTLSQRFTAPGFQITSTPPREPSLTANKPGFVYVSGNVERAGVYGMEKAGMTLDRLLVAAGGTKPEAKRVTVKRGEGEKQITVVAATLEELAKSACTTVLANDDIVTVE